ncbi:DUF1108 family protein [Staphylococcus aureus]|uniref:DUF1108 family protein n=1 Tax=Staphylococcus aureus TaxID=1280 RepID=UPI0018E93D9D|nr:DUF1108 family protein [Staphylococcus aureus]MBJ6292012.1 DUF1108 family protein [Staphylococcus aureus]MBJ6293441.1 DUF1108 family protein [Staphylococcus aureus]MBJ6296605.1 DUF1108 family protein [Staphylococcus aureus]MBJ6306464.1 DUF1108 family protein [Staphylococcus aureus]MBJ6313802.1 DUF1108 family protein [Staphylococcus aureus]
MYYEIGEERVKPIKVDGFKFFMHAIKELNSVTIKVNSIDREEVYNIIVTDESGVQIAMENIYNAIYEWIEENTDEQDRLINMLTNW